MNVWDKVYKASLIALAIALVIGEFIIFTPKIRTINTLERKIADLEQTVKDQKDKLEEWRQKQEHLLNDKRFLERIAREDFGYSKPDERVFKFADDPSSGSSTNR